MESDAGAGVMQNDILSQSYVECVSRVAQQKGDGGLGFVLPKEVLEEREMVWNQFFHKYNQEVPDEVELNLDTMKPIAATSDEEAEKAEDDEAEDEDDEEEDDEEDEEEEEEKYDSKCRAPLRKLPALIQYWIDTGNPPYRLVGDDDDTETGSSLTEGEHSKSGQSDVHRENGEKQKSNTSRCSSVDTAAYILSNTNVTKKAEAMAIVEGAKSSDDRYAGKVSPLKDISGESSRQAVALSPNSCRRSQLNDFIASNTESPNVSSPGEQSVKLSEILPELQEFDEMLEQRKESSTPRTSSSLNKNRENPEDVRSANTLAVIDPKEQGFLPLRKKLQNRRKLYTGRDSPVDLVVERPIGQAMTIVPRSLHPALKPLDPGGDKSAPEARVRRKRKRKRALHISEINSQDGNTSQQSDQPVKNENSKSDARYADFFESLGLTPSRGIAGKPRVGRPAAKRSKTTDRRVLPRNAKNVAPINESLESSMKESVNNSQTEDSIPSPVAKDQNSNGKPAEKVLCGEKTLRVRIERLSDECLARYSRKPPYSKAKEIGEKESPITTSTSSGKSPGKKTRRQNHEKIEVLTTATHDSDSSTILICACNETENARKSDSDAPMAGEKDSQAKKMSLRLRRQKSSAKAATAAAEPGEKLQEIFVQLEKLNVDDVQKTDSGNSTIKFKTSINPASPDENGNKSDLFGPNASKRVTNGNRIFGGELKEKLRRKLRSTRSRCTLGILMPSDDEEDSFVKLISEIGSKRSSTNVKDQQNNNSTGDGKNGSEKSLSRLAISTSSDEEDIDERKIQRRTRNSRDQKKLRESRKTNDDLVDETNNKADAVKKLDNKADAVKTLDESNRRKLRSENTAKDVEAVEAGKRTTRGSKTAQTSARKITKDSLPASKDKVEMDVEDGETRANSNEVGRSTRQNSSTYGSPKNPLPAKTPSRIKSPAKNLFATDKSDAVDLPAWVDGDLNPGNEDSSAKIADRPEEVSESLSPFRSSREVKKIVKVSLSSRFQTRLNCDSDSEFEGLRFSLSGKNTKRSPEKERNGSQNAKIAGAEILRTSPRRSSQNLLARVSERKVKARRGNLFEDGSEPPENPLESEAMEVETSFKNGLASLDELPTNGTKNSPAKERKTRAAKGQFVGRRSRKDSTKSTERSKNQSPTAKQRNQGSRVSLLVKKNKPRRTRIVGNSMDWESDDDTDTNDNKMYPNNTKQGKTVEPLTNGDGTKQSKYDRSTKNLFSPSPNVAEDVDLLFDVGAKTRGQKNAVVIPKLNFASTKKHGKFDGVGSFAMSFRTRLRSDTEDDEKS